MKTKEKTLLEQYLEIKELHKDGVVLFQLGGFYQAYYYDARLLSDVSHLKLTGRAVGGGNIIPMCGIPVNSVEKHTKLLKDLGYKVVICAQTDKLTENGLCSREITEIHEPEEILKNDLTQQWEDYLKYLNPEEFVKTLPQKKLKTKEKETALTMEPSILEELRMLNLCKMTPFDAMNLLYEWRDRLGTPES